MQEIEENNKFLKQDSEIYLTKIKLEYDINSMITYKNNAID